MRKQITDYASDIVSSDRFQEAYGVVHHKNSSVAEHSLRVAEKACDMTNWMNRHGFHISAEDVVRSSLLHDIGMTDSMVHESPSYRKAFWHPRRSKKIADTEYHANRVQKNAISWHMWPICVIPPVHIAGWIVLAADKYCSIKEVILNG